MKFITFGRVDLMKLTFSILLLLLTKAAFSQLTYDNLIVDYDSAITYKNLKIIPIRPKNQNHGGFYGNPKVMSLSTALKNGYATITERGTASTENVHYLRINNHTDSSIYISSGELIAGGRQDRMAMHDTILPPSKKDQYFPVMCVEEERWSDKEKNFVYSGFANPHLRKALDSGKNQVLIWREINLELDRAHVNSKTMAYLSERDPEHNDKKKRKKSDDEFLIGEDYYNYFMDKLKHSDTSIVGIVCVSGDRVIGCDIYAGVNLFYGQMDPLARGYIDDAVLFGGPITISDDDVRKYMDQVLDNEKTQAEFVGKHGKVFKEENKVVHINTF